MKREGAFAMDEPAGWLWAIIGIGLAVLAFAIGYGLFVWRSQRRNPQVKQIQNEVVREHYRRNE
jgi:hypothetical protein